MGVFRSIYARVAGNRPVDADLGERDAAAILLRITANYLRGLSLRPRMGRSGGRLLVARGARVTTLRRLQAGRDVKLEELCEVQCLARRGVTLGTGVTIGRGASIRPSSYYGHELGEGIEVGAGTAIGAYSWIGASGYVEIGRDVLIGPRVVVLPENHVFEDPARPIKLQGVRREGVVIEDDCWIGANATILAGVRIGCGSIVAAGAVVTKNVPPMSIVGGIPARVLRTRPSEECPPLLRSA